jgi:hypothetical protein
MGHPKICFDLRDIGLLDHLDAGAVYQRSGVGGGERDLGVIGKSGGDFYASQIL